MIYTTVVLVMLVVAGAIFTIKGKVLTATGIWIVTLICSVYVLIDGKLPR